MGKHFNNGLSHYMLDKYQKALARFERGLQSKRFASYTERKKRQIWNRLCRYARQVGIVLKPSLVTACLTMGLSLATPAAAQTFTEQTGGANPLNGVSIGYNSVPTFVDIDNDGDKDAFIGRGYGNIVYYKNTGTAAAPVFTAQIGMANPFDGVDVGSKSFPTFMDIDNDGDQDAFIGESNGTILYYKNTGTAAVPVFTATIGAANPFNGMAVGYSSAPTFVDIDNDGDQDAFIGEYYGTVKYYQSTPVVLPIEPLHFSATNQGATNTLYWETANEVNNKGFEIERKQGDTWENIGFTKGQGKAAKYHFVDNTPLPISYYRLRQIDNDGKETLSKVVSVAASKQSKLKAYPSVSSGVLTIEGVENSIFHIYNLLGQEVITGKTAQQIDVSAFAQGTYVLKVGEEQVTFMRQ